MLIEADYDMGEYRWFAAECQDPDMLHDIAEYDAGRAAKPHVKNAAFLFDAPLDEAQTWKDDQHPLHGRYVFAKNFLFGGALYTWKGGVVQLQDAAAKAGLKLSSPKLQAMRDAWWGKWKVAPRWRERLVAEAKQRGYVECKAWGYIRKLHGLDVENEILNYPMQAGIAGLCNRSARELWQAHRWVPLANLHDRLIYRRPAEDIPVLVQSMEQPVAVLRNTHFPVEPLVGPHWGEGMRPP